MAMPKMTLAKPPAPGPQKSRGERPQRPRRAPAGDSRAARRERRTQVVQRSRSQTKKRSLTININKGGAQSTVGSSGGAQNGSGASDSALPGSDFNSNEDIRAFSNALRAQARRRAIERSMDGEQLREVLRHIPGADGSKSGSRARARRVARHLTVIATAEKLIARHSTALYAAFEREFESDLSKVGRGRTDRERKPAGDFKFT